MNVPFEEAVCWTEEAIVVGGGPLAFPSLEFVLFVLVFWFKFSLLLLTAPLPSDPSAPCARMLGELFCDI